MNKIYKLIFDKVLNQTKVASELATKAQAKVDNSASTEDQQQQSHKLVEAPTRMSILTKWSWSVALAPLVGILPIGAAQASNTPSSPTRNTSEAPGLVDTRDASLEASLNYLSEKGFSEKNPGIEVDGTSKGTSVRYQQNVPVVDIANPNAAGVSDNRFKRFNTDTGIVINNNKDGSVSIKARLLANKIAGNPNLKKEAKAILMQVTGNDKSIIKGVFEVLGQRADLIIVNPNGIDLNGLRLVNTREFTATTANVGADNASRLSVNKGEINVNGDLATDEVDVIRLIAKAIKLKATIATTKGKSKQAKIIIAGGKQDYDLKNEKAIKTTSQAEAEPSVAISGAAMGSMYGDQVRFIVTESGAGIEHDGLIVGNDNLEITADGQVKVGNAYSEKELKITSANKDVKVKTAAQSHGKITIKGKNVDTEGAVVHSSTDVEVVATKGNAKTGDLIGKKVTLAANKKVKTKSNAKIVTDNLDIYAGEEVDIASKVYANEKLRVNTGHVDKGVSSAADALVAAGGEIPAVANEETLTKIKFANKIVSTGDSVFSADVITYDGSNIDRSEANENEADRLTRGNDFNFNNVSFTYDLDKKDSGLNFLNGNLVSNNMTLDYHSEEDFPDKKLINIVNSNYKVFQNTYVNTPSRFTDNLVLNSQEQFDKINKFTANLQSFSTIINANRIEIAANQSINIGGNIFKVNSYKNDGLLTVNGSFGVISKEFISNNGTLYVTGTVALTTPGLISINGTIEAGRDMSLASYRIEQTGSVKVNGDMYVFTNRYDLVSREHGELKWRTNGTSSASYESYHDLRRDRAELTVTDVELDTSSMYFSPAETIVGGNFTQKSYPKDSLSAISTKAGTNGIPAGKFLSESASSDGVAQIVDDTSGENGNGGNGGNGNGGDSENQLTQLHLQNGRLYVGKNITVNGDIDVHASTYDVDLLNVLTHKSNINLKIQPLNIFNTGLWGAKNVKFNSLYDFFELVFANKEFMVGPYSFSSQVVLNTLILDHDMSPLMRKSLASVFHSDWEAANFSELKRRWEKFKENPTDYKITVFAPKAEMFAGQTINQTEGKLYVGGDVDRKRVDGSNINDQIATSFSTSVDNGTNMIQVLSARNPLIYEKISGVTSASNYIAAQLHKLKFSNSGKISVKEGYKVPIKAESYKFLGDLNTINSRKNIGDNKALALLVVEQLKDIGGVSLSFGKRLQESFDNLIASTQKHQNAVDSLVDTKEGWTYSGYTGETPFKSREEALAHINQSFDHIEWVKSPDYKDYYMPEVVLSNETRNQLTNFDKVAASVTGVTKFASEQNKGTDIVLGSINSKELTINSTGDINMISVVNQNAINSDRASLTSEHDISLIGNANLGDADIYAANLLDLRSNYYINDRGALYNQGLINGKNIDIRAQEVNMKAMAVQAKGDLTMVTENLNMESRTNLASNIDALAPKNNIASSHTSQVGKFVIGSKLEAKGDLILDVYNDLNMESSVVAAKNDAEINVGNNLTTAVKHDEMFIRGEDAHLGTKTEASIGYGGFKTWSEKLTS